MAEPYFIDVSIWMPVKLAQGTGAGWDDRVNGATPSSLVIHATQGNKGSSFAGEAEYLARSRTVGAHLLTGKAGQIVQFLPYSLRAHHAGSVIWGYQNNLSIGIETHWTFGETWPAEGTAALTWLVRRLMKQFNIPVARIKSHRFVALPKGRKSDPGYWTDRQFDAWLATLAAAPAPVNPRYEVTTARANVRSGPGIKFPVTMILDRGQQFGADSVKEGWYHREDGRGFVSSTVVRKVG